MAARGILLQCIPSETREKSVCSGVLFADKWVLTLGSILDFHPENEPATSRNHMEELRLLESSFSQIHIIPYQSVINGHIFNVIAETDVASTSSSVCARGRGDSAAVTPYKLHDARLVAMWRCPLLSAAIHTLLSDWHLAAPEGNASEIEQKTHGSSKTLLSSFLLFQIGSCPDDRNSLLSERYVKNEVMKLLQQIEIPRRGQEIVIESTLFGREFFLNSLSQGIVSNKLGQRGCLLLTDARSGLGCEGGPIFSNTSHRGLLGLVLSSLSWWKGEWVGFTLGVALHPVLAHLCSGGHLPKVFLKTELPTSNLGEMDKSVLLVRCGRSWGSGVLVDAATGLVLTCSHVVKKTDAAISVVWRGHVMEASLVYRTRDGVAYDLALLRLASPAPSGMQQACLAGSTPERGEAVFVVGFPMFSERTNSEPSPTATRGIISHVGTPPVMLQTTCCVQSGASGAPVFRDNGEVLAIISCNARDIDAGIVFPHVNMAMPTTVFLEPLRKYMKTLDVAVLSKLEEQDEQAQKMWRLNFTTSSL